MHHEHRQDFTCKEIFYDMPRIIKIIEEKESGCFEVVRRELNDSDISDSRLHYLLDVLNTIMFIKKPAEAGKTEVLGL
jgi:hypothetical protein